MLDDKIKEIRNFIEEGTGADIEVSANNQEFRTSIDVWFSDLSKQRGPILNIGPAGLKRHSIRLVFGKFANRILERIASSNNESWELARALIDSTRTHAEVSISGVPIIQDWDNCSGDFQINAVRKNIDDPYAEHELEFSCREIVVPILGAMAELIGYEVGNDDTEDDGLIYEGAVTTATIKRRERNSRNRLLSFRIHGYRCFVCGLDTEEKYRSAGNILEIHHVQPLNALNSPRVYNPSTDLVPLCPNCHRAIHTKRPVPWTPDELIEILGGGKNE